MEHQGRATEGQRDFMQTSKTYPWHIIIFLILFAIIVDEYTTHAEIWNNGRMLLLRYSNPPFNLEERLGKNSQSIPKEQSCWYP